MFRLSSRRVCIETVKQAETADAVVLRMYETMGGTTRVRLSTDLPVVRAWETDLEENKVSEYRVRGSELELEFSPFEIKTVVLE